MVFWINCSNVALRNMRGMYWGSLRERMAASGKTLIHALASDKTLSPSDIDGIAGTLLYVTAPPRKDARLPDILNPEPFVVSARAKHIIELLQPQGQDFIPIRLREKGSEKEISDYFALHLKLRIDCIDYDQTVFGPGTGLEDAKARGFTPSLQKRYYVLKKSAIGEADHLWLAAEPAEQIYFCSDELRRQLDEAGARGWGFVKCR